jgi:hypothetical protein
MRASPDTSHVHRSPSARYRNREPFMTGRFQRYRPNLETLEDRLVPTTTRLVVDFTPSTNISNQFPGFHRRNFVDDFRGGAGLHFLDFNHDGVVNKLDATLAMRTILAKVSKDFAPYASYGATVVGIDLHRQTNRGTAELKRGLARKAPQVFVMYVGGANDDPGIFGESYQAAVGYNNQDYSRVYSDSIVGYFHGQSPNASPDDFASYVASTISHEFGHMLGLGHPIPDYQDVRNIMDSSADGKADSFYTYTYPAELMLTPNSPNTTPGLQNPAQELIASFEGQPNQNAAYTRNILLRNRAFRRAANAKHLQQLHLADVEQINPPQRPE